MLSAVIGMIFQVLPIHEIVISRLNFVGALLAYPFSLPSAAEEEGTGSSCFLKPVYKSLLTVPCKTCCNQNPWTAMRLSRSCWSPITEFQPMWEVNRRQGSAPSIRSTGPLPCGNQKPSRAVITVHLVNSLEHFLNSDPENLHSDCGDPRQGISSLPFIYGKTLSLATS